MFIIYKSQLAAVDIFMDPRSLETVVTSEKKPDHVYYCTYLPL
jgi:hypothetical protein